MVMYIQGVIFMHRTTIMLPDDLKAKAEAVSRKKGLSLSQFVREAMKDLLKKYEGGEKDSFFTDQAVFTGSAPKDISEKPDDYLYGNKA